MEMCKLCRDQKSKKKYRERVLYIFDIYIFDVSCKTFEIIVNSYLNLSEN